MRVVICGGGVIGACTAYFLRRRGVDVIVVERTDIAAAASGKAGGFLARDWCAGTPLDALARRSFALHAQLPEEIAGDWGHRPMSTYSGYVAPDRDPRRNAPSVLDWLSEGIVIARRIGTTETTAIVHPRKFTLAMMNAAIADGAELRHDRVTGIVRDADGRRAKGVEIDGGIIEADAVVIAMGPWSLLAAQWMSLLWTAQPEHRVRPRPQRTRRCVVPGNRDRWRRGVDRGVSTRRWKRAYHRALRHRAAAPRSGDRDA
ncbi:MULTISPECIES: NAD(P)/FAD-dependent oxidoreductase [unclassified Bradyrhizobium]